MAIALRWLGPKPHLLVIVASLSPALAPLLVAAVVLATAGVAKLRRPAATGLAMARAGLPGSDAVVRALGLAEVTAAALAALVGGATALLLVAAYLAFAAFTFAQITRERQGGDAADCGCFGDRSAPVGPLHVGVNLSLAAGAAWAAAVGSEGLVQGLADDAGAALLTAALALVAAAGVQALLTDLPRLHAMRAAT